MAWGLERYQDTGDLHFITFSCYQRQPFLSTPTACRVFEQTLEDVRRWYGLYVKGYVVMPEHVHLLVSEPERSSLRVALQMLKQIVAARLKPRLSTSVGEECQALLAGQVLRLQHQTRKKQIEKLRYIHRNPVHRGLVEKPEDW
jgi:putative transposase